MPSLRSAVRALGQAALLLALAGARPTDAQCVCDSTSTSVFLNTCPQDLTIPPLTSRTLARSTPSSGNYNVNYGVYSLNDDFVSLEFLDSSGDAVPSLYAGPVIGLDSGVCLWKSGSVYIQRAASVRLNCNNPLSSCQLRLYITINRVGSVPGIPTPPSSSSPSGSSPTTGGFWDSLISGKCSRSESSTWVFSGYRTVDKCTTSIRNPLSSDPKTLSLEITSFFSQLPTSPSSIKAKLSGTLLDSLTSRVTYSTFDPYTIEFNSYRAVGNDYCYSLGTTPLGSFKACLAANFTQARSYQDYPTYAVYVLVKFTRPGASYDDTISTDTLFYETGPSGTPWAWVIIGGLLFIVFTVSLFFLVRFLHNRRQQVKHVFSNVKSAVLTMPGFPGAKEPVPAPHPANPYLSAHNNTMTPMTNFSARPSPAVASPAPMLPYSQPYYAAPAAGNPRTSVVDPYAAPTSMVAPHAARSSVVDPMVVRTSVAYAPQPAPAAAVSARNSIAYAGPVSPVAPVSANASASARNSMVSVNVSQTAQASSSATAVTNDAGDDEKWEEIEKHVRDSCIVENPPASEQRVSA